MTSRRARRLPKMGGLHKGDLLDPSAILESSQTQAPRVDRMPPPWMGAYRRAPYVVHHIMIIMGGNARSRANTAPQTANARAKTQRQTSSRRVGGKKSQAGRAIHRARMLDG